MRFEWIQILFDDFFLSRVSFSFVQVFEDQNDRSYVDVAMS